ncbi:MAG: hypothetical protein HZC48_04725 [Nitrospirae bacterium]|nr:hypothetical protein [Nitrospirota bacterium]
MKKNDNKKLTISLFLLLVSSFFFLNSAYAELLERIVAVVNEDTILLSELKNEVRLRNAQGAEVSDAEALDEMIDRKLLLEQAKRMRIEGDAESDKSLMTDDIIINGYIERRVKAFIHIPLKEMEDYYSDNIGSFSNKKFYEVKNEIETKLIETKLKDKLQEHIRDLRKDSYIRVQLD